MFLDTKPPQLQITMSAVVGPCVTKQTAGVLVLMTFGKQLVSCGNESGVIKKSCADMKLPALFLDVVKAFDALVLRIKRCSYSFILRPLILLFFFFVFTQNGVILFLC